MKICKVNYNDVYWNMLIDYANNCSWIAGSHLARMMEENCFTEWESVFVAVSGNEIVGFCTFLKTDYYPENRYYPWISSIFVGEEHRGKRISEKMISKVIEYAKNQGFSEVYIPSEMEGFYEKYGFVKIDELVNYGGDMDNIYAKRI